MEDESTFRQIAVQVSAFTCAFSLRPEPMRQRSLIRARRVGEAAAGGPHVFLMVERDDAKLATAPASAERPRRARHPAGCSDQT